MPFIKGVKTSYASANTIGLRAVDVDNTAIIHDEVQFVSVGMVNAAAAFTLSVPEYKMYLVLILEYIAGNPIGNVIGSYVKDARTECGVNREDIPLKVGGGRALLDPVAGATSVDIPGLAGEIYRIVERNFGPLIEGGEFDFKLTGGWDLLGGATFEDGKDYNIEFFAPGLTASPDIIITVDGAGLYDPVAGASIYRNPNLKDKPGRLVQRGFGPNRQLYLPEITIYADGGFDFLGGKVFDADDVYFWQPYPTVCNTTVADSGSLSLKGEVIVETDTVYDAAHKAKLIVFRGTTSKVQYTLPDIALFPAGVPIEFEGNKGNQVYGCIKTFGSQYIDCTVPNQTNTTKLYVALGEQCTLVKPTAASTLWKVLKMPAGYELLGQDIVSAGVIKNALKKEGQSLDKLVYARLWDWLQENAATVKIISDATWNTTTSKTNPLTGSPFNVKLNAGKVADIDAYNFRLPDERQYHWRNGDNGATQTSEILWDELQSHDHNKFDSPTGLTFDLLLTDDNSGSSSVTDTARDVNADEPNTLRAKPMVRIGGAENLVRSVYKIVQIKI